VNTRINAFSVLGVFTNGHFRVFHVVFLRVLLVYDGLVAL